MAGAAQGPTGRQTLIARLPFLVGLEARRRQARVARRGELGAVEGEVGFGKRMEAEGIAVLHDDTGGLAPDFDNERFGHGRISVIRLRWVRSDGSAMAEIAEAAHGRSKDPACGVNMAMALLSNDVTTLCAT
jgi:hypothetical protein